MGNIFRDLKFDPRKIVIEELSISLPRLSPRFDGYRIAQISDFHLGTWINGEDLSHIIDILNATAPDLVAITGDFVNAHPDRFAHAMSAAFSRIRVQDCVVAVLGNHDHYTNPKKIREILKRSGIIELRNQVLPIERDGCLLYLAGIDDRLTRNDDLDNVISQIPDDGNSAILLSHVPDFADVSSKRGKFDMQISGHTHGGQICLPHLGNLYLPPLGRKYPSGRYQVDGMVLYTNRGIGTSWLKIRYQCSPEISVFTLSS
ncbi:MAG: metallophosphoesterase [Chloroflexota bacterium]|nr:MAG: metallophosphoesterase [Chloroflexota bacterium]